MPSPKDPLSTITPGPGKLPAGTVPAGALLFVSGGGGGAALLAHVTDPVDAHMASAIGVNPYYPPVGGTTPILTSVGGPVDGESVLDFINQAKDLFPVRPNRMGFLNVAIPNSGIPFWDLLDGAGPARPGAWTNGTAAVFSHFILDAATGTPAPNGIVYPADRGVLVVYRSTDGDFLNPGTTTVYGALWLGATADKPTFLTCTSANFNETLRPGAQPDYTASGLLLDQITLLLRLPYLKDYLPYGSPYANYDVNFPSYQLGVWNLLMPAMVDGTDDSYLFVHWKESYAVSDTAIAPAALAANYNATNAYSAVPPNYDAVPVDSEGVQALNRRYLFRDALSATIPTTASWTLSVVGVPATILLSGVAHYSNDGPYLQWNSDLRVDNLFGNSWCPGTISGAELPADFISPRDPIAYNWKDWALFPALSPRAYYELQATGSGTPYTMAAAPLPADQAQDLIPVMGVGLIAPWTNPGFGYAQVAANLSRPASSTLVSHPDFWLYNTYSQTGGGTDSTATFEPFRDERYRYIGPMLYTPVATARIEPALVDHYDNTAIILAGGNDLQVIGDQAIYPQVNYGAAGFHPVGQPDYSAVLAGDAPFNTRHYMRAFNTGIARNTGRIRIKGLTLAAFTSPDPFTGTPEVDHPGGCGLVIMVPGSTHFLDLGRPYGNPDLNVALPFRGCQTGIVSLSLTEHIISYTTSFFTGDNGFGEFPLFLTFAFFKGPGTALYVDEVEWLAP